jgi:hypothetical protein
MHPGIKPRDAGYQTAKADVAAGTFVPANKTTAQLLEDNLAQRQVTTKERGDVLDDGSRGKRGHQISRCLVREPQMLLGA